MDIKENSGQKAEETAVPVRPAKKEAFSEYGEIGRDVRRFAGAVAGDYSSFREVERMFSEGETQMVIHRREVRYDIDEEWVRMIEDTLPHLEIVVRKPRVELREVGDVKRIEQSRNINNQSIKNLTQHSNYINSYDETTDMVNPSRILNVVNEEDEATYENKFINTLIRQLYYFVNYRFQKISEMVDQTVTTLEMTSDFRTPTADGKYKLSVELTDAELTESEMDPDEVSEDAPLVRRISKIKQLVDGYRASDFVKRLGEKNMVRPPITRTNALSKNKDLRACLTLWEYISSYNKPGYRTEINEFSEELSREGREQMLSLGAFQYAAFRYEQEGEGECYSERHDDMLYDHDGLEESIEREAGQSGADGNGGLGEASPVYASRDTLTPADRAILRTLNAALEADMIYNELGVLGKQNISRYLSLGMTVEQLKEMAIQTQRRRVNT